MEEAPMPNITPAQRQAAKMFLDRLSPKKRKELTDKARQKKEDADTGDND